MSVIVNALAFLVKALGLAEAVARKLERDENKEQGRVEQNARAQDKALQDVQTANRASSSLDKRTADELRNDTRLRRD